MKDFITRKWQIIEEESKKTGTPGSAILLRKILLTTFSFPFRIVDIFFTILCLPLLMLVVSAAKFLPKTNTIFFIGLEHVINKTAERGIGYEQKGYKSYFFSYEWSGMKHSLPFRAEIINYSRLLFWDTIVYAFSLIRRKPCYVEVYFEGSAYRQLFAVLLSKLYGSVIVSIERGVWHGFKEHRLPFLLGWRYILIFKMSDKIFYRELGLFEIYDNYKLSRDKFYFDYNKVKVYEEPSYEKKQPEVLYLNSFKSFRRVDLFIKAIPLVKKQIPNATFKMIGARSEEDISFVKKELVSLQVEDSAEVDYWSPKPVQHYETAAVFVLPAELVFCNFSLIEAMERGLPPVVTNVVDADKIVEDGIDGLLCPMNETGIADAIVELLRDEEKRQKIGRNARLKIIRDFNSDKRLDPIVELIQGRHNINDNK